MIFLTVGTQLSFDRLVRSVDDWARSKRNPPEIFAQIGSSSFQPEMFNSVASMDPKVYDDCFEKASVIVSHAGMGTILRSLMSSKPIIVLPRKFAFGEHRNDHQLATCRKFEYTKGCFVAWEESELPELLDRIDTLIGGSLSPFASDKLIESLINIIES